MKPSGIGGQAVIEGVMMKNKDQYAVAVRKPDKEIAIEISTFVSASDKYTFFKLPIFRGMLAFVESMIIGMKTLTYSASFFEEVEEAEPSKLEKAFSKIFKDKAESIAMGITVFISIILAMGIFFLLPTLVAGLLIKQIHSDVLLAIIEGCIRILIFVSYILAISQMNDIKRMFMYHGAEHKTINCVEHGLELTVENVKGQSKQHKRCGTSFMFLVMFVSIIFFIFIRVDQQWLRLLSRILLVPVIAGVSYEFIRLAGRSESKIVNILSKPGMWMQNLTTKEPDDSMIEVAIQSVEAVFDWRKFLSTDTSDIKNNKKSISKVNSKNPANNGKTVNNAKAANNAKADNNAKAVNNAKAANNAKASNTVKGASNIKTENNQNSEITKNVQNNQNNNANKKNSKPNDKNSKYNNKYNNININKDNINKDNDNIKDQKDLSINDEKDNKTEENIEKVLLKNSKVNIEPSKKELNKLEEETAVTAEKTVIEKIVSEKSDEDKQVVGKSSAGSRDSLMDEEEDDEILKALDRYLIFKEENKEKD